MKAATLTTRTVYAVIAFLLGAVVTFFYLMQVLPEFTRIFPELDPDLDGYLIFRISLCAAMLMASSLALYELTQPGARPRKSKGRDSRMAMASVVVVLSSLAFSGLGWRWFYDLIFAAWMAYNLGYTFVRYGVLDEVKQQDALKAYQKPADA